MEGKRVKDTALVTAIQMLPSDANPAGNVHGGVIMKHVDGTAGIVMQRHSGVFAVTASIDRLDFFHPMYVGDLLILKASLNYVGTTSGEIGVRVEAETLRTGVVRHTASAYLTFVALGRDGKPTPVPPLILENPDEERRHRQAIERRKTRLAEKERERVGHEG
jgi:acyl-CoA hydrolase